MKYELIITSVEAERVSTYAGHSDITNIVNHAESLSAKFTWQSVDGKPATVGDRITVLVGDFPKFDQEERKKFLELKIRLKQAVPGPWGVIDRELDPANDTTHVSSIASYHYWSNPEGIFCAVYEGEWDDQPTAEFLAGVPNDIAWLIELVERAYT